LSDFASASSRHCARSSSFWISAHFVSGDSESRNISFFFAMKSETVSHSRGRSRDDEDCHGWPALVPGRLPPVKCPRLSWICDTTRVFVVLSATPSVLCRSRSASFIILVSFVI
jgi:hypothetical protein